MEEILRLLLKGLISGGAIFLLFSSDTLPTVGSISVLGNLSNYLLTLLFYFLLLIGQSGFWTSKLSSRDNSNQSSNVE